MDAAGGNVFGAKAQHPLVRTPEAGVRALFPELSLVGVGDQKRGIFVKKFQGTFACEIVLPEA